MPAEVAEAMLKMIEDPDMVGGTMLEVAYQNTRVVPLFGNMGPQTEGTTSSNMAVNVKEVYDWLGTEGWGKVEKARS